MANRQVSRTDGSAGEDVRSSEERSVRGGPSATTAPGVLLTARRSQRRHGLGESTRRRKIRSAVKSQALQRPSKRPEKKKRRPHIRSGFGHMSPPVCVLRMRRFQNRERVRTERRQNEREELIDHRESTSKAALKGLQLLNEAVIWGYLRPFASDEGQRLVNAHTVLLHEIGSHNRHTAAGHSRASSNHPRLLS